MATHLKRSRKREEVEMGTKRRCIRSAEKREIPIAKVPVTEGASGGPQKGLNYLTGGGKRVTEK